MNIGPQEIILLMLFALIVFGPKRLPEIGRQVGKAIREVRKVSREFEREVRAVTKPLEDEVRSMEKEAKALKPGVEVDEDASSFMVPPPVEQDTEGMSTRPEPKDYGAARSTGPAPSTGDASPTVEADDTP